MNQQDQQAIDELFRYLGQTAAQAGPPDRDAEKLIQKHLKHGPPGLVYQMAQTLVAQQATINQLRARQAQGGAPAGFAPPGGGYQGGYGQPQYQQGQYQQPYQQYGRQRQGGGFLAGAGQLALGIGGGILGAEVLTSIFDGGGGLFGDGDRQYDEGFQQGFEAGDRDQNDYQGQGPGQYDDGGQYDQGGFDQGGFDDGGGGGFDDGGTF
jgi:hypothetical protein